MAKRIRIKNETEEDKQDSQWDPCIQSDYNPGFSEVSSRALAVIQLTRSNDFDAALKQHPQLDINPREISLQNGAALSGASGQPYEGQGSLSISSPSVCSCRVGTLARGFNG